MLPSSAGFKFDLQAQSLANCRFLSKSRSAVFFAVTAMTPSGQYRAIIFQKDRHGEVPYIASRLRPTVDIACEDLHSLLAAKVHERYEAAIDQENQGSLKTRASVDDDDSEFSRDDIMTPDSDSDTSASESEPEVILRQRRRRRDTRKSKHHASPPSVSRSVVDSLDEGALSSDGSRAESYHPPRKFTVPMSAPPTNTVTGVDSRLSPNIAPPTAGTKGWQQYPGFIQISNPQPQPQPQPPPAVYPRNHLPPALPQRLPGMSPPRPQGETYLARLHLTWNGRGEARTLQHVSPSLGAIQSAALNFSCMNQAVFSKPSPNSLATTLASPSYRQSRNPPPCQPFGAIVRKVQFDGETYEISALDRGLGDITKILRETSGIPGFEIEIIDIPPPPSATALPPPVPGQGQQSSVPPPHPLVSLPWGTQKHLP